MSYLSDPPFDDLQTAASAIPPGAAAAATAHHSARPAAVAAHTSASGYPRSYDTGVDATAVTAPVRPSAAAAPAAAAAISAGLLFQKKLPEIRLEKYYAFRCSLQRLQYAGSELPPSSTSCENCERKRIKCICETVSTQLGSTPAFVLPELKEVRSRLDDLRMQLSEINIGDWKRHTNCTDLMKRVLPTVKEKIKDSMGFGPELLINSWLKLYEILAQTPALNLKVFAARAAYEQQQQQRGIKTAAGAATALRSVRTVHLCECPGGFIAATNHFIKTTAKGQLRHNWRAHSLNPYYEGADPQQILDDDVLYRQTENLWLRGGDDSGNLISKKNIEAIWNKTSRELRTKQTPYPFGLADLVTADGSFDVQHAPEQQEELLFPLILSEIVCMLGLINMKGTAVIKLYGLLTHYSVCLLAILSMCFNHVVILKPLMSRPGNSELYALCLDFVGIRSSFLSALSNQIEKAAEAVKEGTNALIPKHWLPPAFLEECVQAASFFADSQMQQIDHNLQLYGQVDSATLKEINHRQREIATNFIRRNRLEPIRVTDRIVRDMKFIENWTKFSFTNSTRRGPRPRIQGNLSERLRFKQLCEEQQFVRQRQWLLNGFAKRTDGAESQHGRVIALFNTEAVAAAVIGCLLSGEENAVSVTQLTEPKSNGHWKESLKRRKVGNDFGAAVSVGATTKLGIESTATDQEEETKECLNDFLKIDLLASTISESEGISSAESGADSVPQLQQQQLSKKHAPFWLHLRGGRLLPGSRAAAAALLTLRSRKTPKSANSTKQQEQEQEQEQESSLYDHYKHKHQEEGDLLSFLSEMSQGRGGGVGSQLLWRSAEKEEQKPQQEELSAVSQEADALLVSETSSSSSDEEAEPVVGEHSLNDEEKTLWLDELSQAMQRKDYLQTNSTWFLSAVPALDAWRVNISRFAEDRLFLLLMEKRLLLPFLFPYFPADYFVAEAAAAHNRQQRQEQQLSAAMLPSAEAVDFGFCLLLLIPVLRRSLLPNAAAPKSSSISSKYGATEVTVQQKFESKQEQQGLRYACDDNSRQQAQQQGQLRSSSASWRKTLRKRYSFYVELSSRCSSSNELSDRREKGSSGIPNTTSSNYNSFLVKTARAKWTCEVLRQCGCRGLLITNTASRFPVESNSPGNTSCCYVGEHRKGTDTTRNEWEESAVPQHQEVFDVYEVFRKGTKSAQFCAHIKGLHAAAAAALNSSEDEGETASTAKLVYADITGLEQLWVQQALIAYTASGSDKSFFCSSNVLEAEYSEFAQAELQSHVLLVGQILQALTLLGEEGDLILRMHTAYTRVTASLLFLLSSAFLNVCIYTPPSLPVWRNQRFFIGFSLIPEAAEKVTAAIAALWDKLVDLRAPTGQSFTASAAAQECRKNNPASAVESAEGQWALFQCLSAQLFTGLPLVRWLCAVNNVFLKAQIRDATRRLSLFNAALYVARKAEDQQKQQDPHLHREIEAALHLRCDPHERLRICLLFLQRQGVTELFLPEASPLRKRCLYPLTNAATAIRPQKQQKGEEMPTAAADGVLASPLEGRLAEICRAAFGEPTVTSENVLSYFCVKI